MYIYMCVSMHARTHVWALPQSAAEAQCEQNRAQTDANFKRWWITFGVKLRGRELNPGLPRDRRKY